MHGDETGLQVHFQMVDGVRIPYGDCGGSQETTVLPFALEPTGTPIEVDESQHFTEVPCGVNF